MPEFSKESKENRQAVTEKVHYGLTFFLSTGICRLLTHFKIYTFIHSLTLLSPFFGKNCKYFKVHLHNRKIGYRPVGTTKTHTSESLPALNDTLWGPAYLSDMDYA